MPIESIQTPKAPADWQPSRDQQARIQGDPRLRRLSRDELYLAMNNQPATARGAPSDRGKVREAAGNAMAWHPAVIFDKITQAMRNATGN